MHFSAVRAIEATPDRPIPAPRLAVAPSAPAKSAAGSDLFSADVWDRLGGAMRLSARELEILRAIFDDQKESAIAWSLGISPHTVHTHIERIYKKVGVASRCQLLVRVFAQSRSI